MRRTLALVVAGSLLTTSIVAPSSAPAGWRNQGDELPGMMSDTEMTTSLAIAGIVGGAGLLVALTAPHPGAVTEGRGLPVVTEADARAAIERIGGEEAPVKVTFRGKQPPLFGYLRPGSTGTLEVLTGDGSETVAAADITRIENLEQAHQRRTRSRLGMALVFGGVSAASFYTASTESSSLEGDSHTLSTTMGVAFAALAVTTLVLPNGDAAALNTLRASAPGKTAMPVALGIVYDPSTGSPTLVAAARF